MIFGSKRTDDMKAETALADFLDMYFYGRLREQNVGLEFQRMYDIKYQYEGIDVIIEQEKKGCTLMKKHPFIIVI